MTVNQNDDDQFLEETQSVTDTRINEVGYGDPVVKTAWDFVRTVELSDERHSLMMEMDRLGLTCRPSTWMGVVLATIESLPSFIRDNFVVQKNARQHPRFTGNWVVDDIIISYKDSET